MSNYPEHDKLSAVVEESQTIGEFLEWCSSEKGWFLARQPIGDERGVGGLFADRPMHVSYNINEILAQFFSINLDVIEQEKRAMLEELRRMNNATQTGGTDRA